MDLLFRAVNSWARLVARPNIESRLLRRIGALLVPFNLQHEVSRRNSEQLNYSKHAPIHSFGKRVIHQKTSVHLGAWTHLPVSVMQETAAAPNLAHRLV